MSNRTAAPRTPGFRTEFPTITPALWRRFWEKVAVGDGCWEWQACISDNGYGEFRAEISTGWRTFKAHRLSYVMFGGSLDSGNDEIDHTCWNRRCIRPDHLQKVDKALNMQNRSGYRVGSVSQVRGVCRNNQGTRWRVRVKVNRVEYYGGLFDELAAAEQAAIALRNLKMTNNLTDRRSNAPLC